MGFAKLWGFRVAFIAKMDIGDALSSECLLLASVIVKAVKVLRFRTLFLLQRPLYST